MKIAFLLPNLKAGGGNRSQIMLANGLAKKGHDVAILVPRGHVYNTPMDINVTINEIGLPIKGFYFNSLINYPLIGFKSVHYDAVIITFSLMLWATFLPCWLLRKKIYLFARHYDPLLLDKTKINSDLLRSIYKLLTRLSYNLSTKLLVNSKWTGDIISKNSFRKLSYKIINNAVDHSVFNNHHDSSYTGSRNNHKSILVLGKKQKWKGLDDAFEALNILAQKGPNFELIIVTPDDITINGSPPYKVKIIHPANDKELADIYRNADIFVSSSWYEGFCLPPLEAMACGTPVALTDSGGVKEYAINEYNCLMSPPRKPTELSENIATIINNKTLTDKFIRNGLNTAQNLQWYKSIDQFEEFICQKTNNT